jgi:hypothetical protein
VRRRALLPAVVVVAVAAAVATVNGIVDPKDEFYSADALTAALKSNCLIADDVVRARSYPEFKHDLYRRRRPTAVVLTSDAHAHRGLNMGFLGFGTGPLLDTIRFLSTATPQGERLTVSIETSFAWFDPNVSPRAVHRSLVGQAGYLLSPWTLKSSLELIRRSRKLAFTGWQKVSIGGACVVDRGSSSPAWRADGTLDGAPRVSEPVQPRGFAWSRLSQLDAALAIARAHGWRVAGFSDPSPHWETYERELSALFAKHGYHWRVRRMHP